MGIERVAWGYIRVSLESQVREGFSLDAQKEKIRRWASDHGYQLQGIVEDAGISGKAMSNRPGLQEVLSKVRKGNAVVVYSLSRLARSTKDTIQIAEDMARRGVDLVSLTESLDTTSAAGKMLFRLLAVLGEFERDLISERTSLSLRHLQGQHSYIGGHAPYGWAREGDKVVPVQAEQDAVIIAIQMRSEGRSLRAISQALASMGMLNRRGKLLAASQVQRILSARTNPLRVGIFLN